MKKRAYVVKILLGLAAGFVLLESPAPAPTMPGMVVGYVTNAGTGQPVAGATVTLTGTASGTVVKTTNADGLYLYSGAPASITASAKAVGFISSGSVPVNLLEGSQVTQNFPLVSNIPVHAITVSTEGKGRITDGTGRIDCGAQCKTSVSENTTIILVATPDSGWLFDGWLGACSGKAACSVTMNGAKEVTARFLRPKPGIGIFSNGSWYLDVNQNLVWDGASGDLFGSFIPVPNAVAVTGDWNGDGKTGIGLFVNGDWYLDMNHNGQWDGELIDKHCVFGAGLPNAKPVVGDWNGDGKTKIGVFSDGTWYLDKNGSGTWDGASVDLFGTFGSGLPDAKPLVGNW